MENRTHMNHTISVTSEWTFEVEGPEFDASRYKMTFQSLQAAKEEIQKRVSDSNRLAAANIKIDLSLLDEQANIVTVTKINRSDGDLVGVKGTYVYPNTQFVRNLLVQVKRHKEEARKIEETLRPLKINVGRGYGRIKAEDYINTVKYLQRDYNEALAKAKALADPTPPVLAIVNERSE